MVVADWYRAQHPESLLISLDSSETRRWMNLDEDSKRADLLGVALEGDALVIDILESKSGVADATRVYTIDGDGKIRGKPVEQLLNTGRSIGAIFGLNSWKNHVLTPPRREILRNHLYRQGLAGNRTPEQKQLWSKTLNSLFAGDTTPVIRLNLIVVNLGVNDAALDETIESEDGPIRLVHLNEHNVSEQLRGEAAIEPPTEAPEPEDESPKPAPQGPRKQLRETASTEPDEEKESTGTERETDDISEVSASNENSQLREQIASVAEKLKAACQDFGIKVAEIDPDAVDIGPSVLRYKIKLAPGEDSARLRKQAENIARQLAATSVPIIGFLPGTHFEYLDLPRPDRQKVPLDPLLDTDGPQGANELRVHVGVDPAGHATDLDLADDKIVHILVAGGTGSGKTIFLYSVVLSLIWTHAPDNLELVIIDPKQTDFNVFSRVPHLRNGEIITDAQRGVDAIQQIADHDMQSRSEELTRAGYRDIKQYNAANPKKQMRPLVIVIDEYADLVSVLTKKERERFEKVVSRLTARGRNVGIHLVLATQRPTSDIVTGTIKANMPCRISFSLPSYRDSQVILDETGAERLLRNGDMLLLIEGKLNRLQGYYIDPAHIEGYVVPRK
jgi:DNA segregation ATPase FtsK/SpoIIIE-like protein